MTKKEQQGFDEWWRKNRIDLIAIYNERIDFNIAVMEIAESAWKGALNAENDTTE